MFLLCTTVPCFDSSNTVIHLKVLRIKGKGDRFRPNILSTAQINNNCLHEFGRGVMTMRLKYHLGTQNYLELINKYLNPLLIDIYPPIYVKS